MTCLPYKRSWPTGPRRDWGAAAWWTEGLELPPVTHSSGGGLEVPPGCPRRVLQTCTPHPWPQLHPAGGCLGPGQLQSSRLSCNSSIRNRRPGELGPVSPHLCSPVLLPGKWGEKPASGDPCGAWRRSQAGRPKKPCWALGGPGAPSCPLHPAAGWSSCDPSEPPAGAFTPFTCTTGSIE